MREAIGTGETVELAKEAACKELGVESYEADFEILEMPTKKTFGLFGGSPAKVRVFLEDDAAQLAVDYLKKIFSCMDIPEVQIEIQREEKGALLSLTGEDIGFIIGHRGETLDALQYLAGLVANHAGKEYYRIALDIGNYREKRCQTLESLGRKTAEKSLRLGRNVSLEPMNPYERRIIHTSVQTVEGAKSWSEGEGLERHVMVGPIAGERIQHRPGGTRGNYGSTRRNDGQHRPPYRGRQQRPYGGGYGNHPQYAKTAAAVPAAPVQPAKPKADDKGSLYGRIDAKK